MIRFLLVLILAFTASLTAHAQTPTVSIEATTPDTLQGLSAGQSLYVRIAYDSAQPLRFQAKGYREGKEAKSLYFNPAPVYPAGKGTAIAWLFGNDWAEIDELRVAVFDNSWNPLPEVAAPIHAQWRTGRTKAPTADWAPALLEAQKDLPPPPPQPFNAFSFVWSTLAILLTPLVFLSVPGYPILQFVSLVLLKGRARLLSALPLLFMIPIYAFCLYTLSRDSNLWPLYAIFASPFAFLITLFFLWTGRQKRTPSVPNSV